MTNIKPEVELKNHIFTLVENRDNAELIFTRNDGRVFMFYHEQDCCESVSITDINGNLDDLVGEPLRLVQVAIASPEQDYDHETWTFYKFGTIKGFVDVRWEGLSNGYYSESVDFKEVGVEE